MAALKTFRLLKMGLSTVLGIRRQGFFIPYRYAEKVPQQNDQPPYSHVENIFDNSRHIFKEQIALINQYTNELRRIGPDNPPQPRWNQEWFPALDGAIAYCMVRHHAPKNIIEVGSGHSTRFMARAVADGLLDSKITAIDPAPRASIEGLNVEISNTTVQGIDISFFDLLIPGDILFIDSSHIMMPGTDVDFLFNRVLAKLPVGVIIHIHDIFLPDDYPESWQWRGYNEQLAVATLLQGKGFDVLFSSHYVATRMSESLQGTLLAELKRPDCLFETSLWLKKSSN